MAPADERWDHSTARKRAGGYDRSRNDTIRQRKLLRAAQRGDCRACERLIVSHLGLVRRVASRYRGLGLPFDDLVQEGSLGLLDAIERYDPRRNADFETFARFRVRRAIRNALTNQARLVRLPKQVVERRRVVSQVEAAFKAAKGRAPAPTELAAVTGLSPTAVLDAQAAALAPVSLDELAASRGSARDALIADSEAPDPELQTVSKEEARLVRRAVDRLSPRQREIVTRHFGLNRDEVGIAAVARDLHLSERRTRTIEQEALQSLARQLEQPRAESKR